MNRNRSLLVVLTVAAVLCSSCSRMVETSVVMKVDSVQEYRIGEGSHEERGYLITGHTAKQIIVCTMNESAWIFFAGDSLIFSNDGDELGSIGTYMVNANDMPANATVRVTMVFAGTQIH